MDQTQISRNMARTLVRVIQSSTKEDDLKATLTETLRTKRADQPTVDALTACFEKIFQNDPEIGGLVESYWETAPVAGNVVTVSDGSFGAGGSVNAHDIKLMRDSCNTQGSPELAALLESLTTELSNKLAGIGATAEQVKQIQAAAKALATEVAESGEVKEKANKLKLAAQNIQGALPVVFAIAGGIIGRILGVR